MVIATLPAAGVFFTSYEGCKSTLSPALAGYPLHLVSSSLAELASCAVLTPAEIIKQRAQVTRKSAYQVGDKPLQGAIHEVERQASGVSKGEKTISTAAKQAANNTASQTVAGQTARATASNLTRDAGLLNTFVRGYFALAGRNLPFTALQFPLYEHFRGVLSKRYNVRLLSDIDTGEIVARSETSDGDGSPKLPTPGMSDSAPSRREAIVIPGAVAAASAAMAGSFAALVSTPIDNAKTRIMINNSSGAASDPCVQGGTIRTMTTIFQREGWKALWRGGLLRSSWTALGAGIYLGSYESGRLWWRSRNRSADQS